MQRYLKSMKTGDSLFLRVGRESQVVKCVGRSDVYKSSNTWRETPEAVEPKANGPNLRRLVHSGSRVKFLAVGG